MCFSGKEKRRLLKTIGVSCKVEDKALKDVEKFVQTACYSEKKRRDLLKQGALV